MVGTMVCISGNIGVGKTSFIEQYCQSTGAVPLYEAFAANPYLHDFYADMPRWAFASQVFFLTERVRQQRDAEAVGGVAMMDRGLYEDAAIFARNLYLQGAFSERDWQTYQALHAALSGGLRPPDLIVYLQASVPVLQERIKRRGRSFESGISGEYLTQLQSLYDDWAQSLQGPRFLTVATDGLDFVRSAADFAGICVRIQDALVSALAAGRGDIT